MLVKSWFSCESSYYHTKSGSTATSQQHAGLTVTQRTRARIFESSNLLIRVTLSRFSQCTLWECLGASCFLLPPHCRVSTTEKFRIRTAKSPHTTKVKLKGAGWNPSMPDSEYQGWMNSINSKNHSRHASDTRRRSLARWEEASDGHKQ